MKPMAFLEMIFLQLISDDCLISQRTWYSLCVSFPRSETLSQTDEYKEELQLNLVVSV